MVREEENTVPKSLSERRTFRCLLLGKRAKIKKGKVFVLGFFCQIGGGGGKRNSNNGSWNSS